MGQVTPKREYQSTRRQEQARETRRRIIEAARILFIEKGYAGTSINVIAREAGVAAETVYSIFKNKRGVLAAVVDYSVVGDDLPLRLLQRPNIQAARQETNQLRLIYKFATDIAAILRRMAPVFALLRSAAQTEPEIAVMLDELLHERLKGMSYFVEQLARIGPLRDGLETRPAAETVWVVSSAEVFLLLIDDLSWTEEQYVQWLEDSLVHLLLPEYL
jgi:TetR/AcrR family transcriptional regulator of autoinduction and epiphytic fitness